MRTTLKKGTRGTTNGFGTLPPPPPPPSASSAPSFYSMPRRNPLRLLGKFVMWIVVLVFVAAGALAGGSWLFFNHSVAAIRPQSKEVIEAQKILEAPAPGEPTTAIMIGYDARPGPNSALGSRSDTIMLIRADPGDKTVSLMSFPRDLRVEIPGCKNQPAFVGRINEAYTYCGPRGTLQTVKKLTGIPINYMITVNFNAFTRIVDRLGGVFMDVDRRYFNDNSGLAPGQTYERINLKPGYQKLNGKRALDFVRYRHTDSDLYRVVRQQEFVKAFKQQVSSTWTLFQLPGIVNTITDNVEVAKGGKQAINAQEVLGYARLAYQLPAGNFQQVQIENIYEEPGSFLLGVNEEDLQDAVGRFLHPDVDSPDRAIAVATGRKPKGGPEPSDVTVTTLNGNGVTGSAGDAAYLLGQRGYVTKTGGNASTFDYFHTTIFWDPAQKNSRAAAGDVARLFGDAEVKEAPAGQDLSSMVLVVVGKTFGGTLAPSAHVETPKRQPPAVVKDAAAVRPLLRRLQRKADFPILVPTVREKSSSLSDEDGVRLYRLEDGQGLRLAYQLGSGIGEYWGVQETNWTDAPILNGSTLTRRIRGREYRLYFNGPKLHMVAFEQDDSVYWVVNTLLNKLSNETMLAIARGLRPLPEK